MQNNFRGELIVMDNLEIKPNYAALGFLFFINRE